MPTKFQVPTYLQVPISRSLPGNCFWDIRTYIRTYIHAYIRTELITISFLMVIFDDRKDNNVVCHNLKENFDTKKRGVSSVVFKAWRPI